MFEPPFCPNRACPRFRDPAGRFYVRRGAYRAKCRREPVPRFRCKTCARWFSRQTFRGDYRDHKPALNMAVLTHLCSGVGLRHTARMVGLTRRNLVNKARKLARVGVAADRNLQVRERRRALARGGRGAVALQMDELITYEGCRYSRPVAVANVIEPRSRFFIASEVASIRPSGRMTERRKRQIARDEARFGRRVDESPRACVEAFSGAARLFPTASVVVVDTDQRACYPGYLRTAFRGRRILHRQTPGSAPRGHGTPLFPINQTEAVLRDHLGRVRRESWLVSKERRWLQLFVDLHRALRNWTRPRFNFDVESPAQLLGFAPRRLAWREFFRWRQDWGQRSPDPFGRGRRTLMSIA
jgi:transposase-like protein